MNVLLAYQTQQLTIEMPNVQLESARAKAQGAKIWGQGAGQGVLAQGKAKAKGGKSGKGVAKTGAAGKGKAGGKGTTGSGPVAAQQAPPSGLRLPLATGQQEVKEGKESKEIDYGACVHCHTKFTDDSIYCRHCGVRRLETSLDWDQVDEVSQAHKDPPGSAQIGTAEQLGQDAPGTPEFPGPMEATASAPSSGPLPFEQVQPPKQRMPPPMPPPPGSTAPTAETGEEAAEEEVAVPWKVEPVKPKAAPKAKVVSKAKVAPKSPRKPVPPGAPPKAIPKPPSGTPAAPKKEVSFNCPMMDSEGGEITTVTKAVSVKELKALASESLGISEKDLRIVLDSAAGRRVLQDTTEVLDANLLSAADLVVEQPVALNVVDVKGNTSTIKADRSWSSAKLKSVVAAQSGFDEDDILLKFSRTPLPASDQPLGDFLPAGPQQELILSRPVDVSISDDAGHRWVISADRSWKLRKVQQKLMEESGFALEEQTLQHAKLNSDGKLPTLAAETELDEVVQEGAQERGVKEAREARRRQAELDAGEVMPSAPGSNFLSALPGLPLPWEQTPTQERIHPKTAQAAATEATETEQIWKYPPHSLDYTRLLSRKPQKVEFSALLVDPPWRQTQAESEGEESQGKGWEGSDASDASDGSDGSGRSPAVAKPSDKAKQLRRVPSDTSEEEEEETPARPARPARRRDSDSEDLESGDSLDSAGAPVAPGARAEESEKSEESGDELFHHQDLQTAEVGSKKSAARVEVPRIEARTSGNFGSASQRSSQRSNHSSDMSNGSEADQDSPTWGTDLGAYAETAASGRGPGLTGHMSPSLVPWGGFQRLRDSVAPGPGTIVFVNPQDHPGIGTPGGSRSAAKRVLRRQRLQDARAGHADAWHEAASSNRIRSSIRQELQELRRPG